MITHATLGKLEGEELTIRLPKHDIEKLKNFKQGDLCRIEIKRPKDKRTLEQNRYIWEIIHQIDKRVNGYISDETAIYKQLLRQAKIKTDYIQALETIKPRLEEIYRIVEEVERRTGDKNESVLYRCYIGTSKFTKQEMSDFIEVLITRAYQEGIDIMQYEEILRGKK